MKRTTKHSLETYISSLEGSKRHPLVHNSSIRCLKDTKCVHNGQKWVNYPCKICYHMWLEDTQCLK